MRFSIVLATCLTLSFLPSLSAQSASGTILGSVRDSTGAAIPNATITIANQQTGFHRDAPTDSNGDYEIPYVPLGNYVVSAKSRGFKTTERSGLTLEIDQKARLDFTLTVGEVSETVTVTEAPPLVKADSSEVGEVVQQKTVQDLPLNGRNYVQLVFLTSGVTTGQQGGNIEGSGAFVQRGTGSFNANGQRGQNNNFMVDGIDNNESWINSTILQPSVEATREFKVYTANAPAEFGRSSGGIVNLQTRSGSNQYHGSVFEYLRNAALDSRNFFQRKTNLDMRRIPNFVQNQFGGTFGGPIVHNRWFIFGDYQGFRQALGLDLTSTVPSALQKQGNFGGIPIYDPLTTRVDPNNANNYIRDQFPNNTIPAARIPRQAGTLVNLYPDPNVAGTVNNYFFSPSRYQNDDAFNVRSDKIVSQSNNLFVRVSRGHDVTSLPGTLPAPANSTVPYGPYVGADNTQGADSADFNLVTWGGVISDTHVFRPNLVNEFRIGFSRFDLHAVPKNLQYNSAAAIGITGINDAVPPYSGGLIGVRPTGYMNLGNITPIPSISQNTNYQITENLTHIVGRHSLKYGFQVIRRHLNFFESQDPARGFFNFDSTFTNLPNVAGTGNTIASLLLGFPARITRTTLLGPFGLRAWEYAGYVQDDFKVNQRLTLNLGLRYELYPPLTEVAGRIANFNFDPANPALSLIARNGDKYAGRKIDPLNFAPRIGFAYSLSKSGRTVLRGSYGIHYVSVHYAGQGAIGRNPPFMPTQDFQPGSLFVGRNVADGLPIPVPTPLDTAAKLNAAGGSIYAIQLDSHTPRAQQYGLGIQHEITSGLLLDVGYVGTHGSHLFSTYNLNQPVPGPTALAARRPIQLLSNLPTINYFGFFGDSNYQSLQTKLSKRFNSGLEFLAVYTWAKSLDDAIAGSSGQRNRPSVSSQYQDINNIRSARGLSSFDIAGRLVFSGFYELPFGRGKRFASDSRWLMEKVAGGWQVNTIITMQSGLPFTPVLAANGLNNGNFQLPNRIGSGALPDAQRTIQQWFNTSLNPSDPNRAFDVPALYAFGNSGYNILRGPGLQTVDFAIHKNFAMTERLRLQIRGEGFNILNRANFALPNINLGAAAGGSISSTITTSRQIQLVAKIEF